MYVLTISNTVMQKNETYVYGDVDPGKALDVVTEDVANSITTCLDRAMDQAAESANDIENLLIVGEELFSENMWNLMKIIHMAPVDISWKLLDLHELWKKSDFKVANKIFCDDTVENSGPLFDYFISWTLFDNGKVYYLAKFKSPTDYIYVELKHKDTYDTLD